jgi:RHS repeat-associated protein
MQPTMTLLRKSKLCLQAVSQPSGLAVLLVLLATASSYGSVAPGELQPEPPPPPKEAGKKADEQKQEEAQQSVDPKGDPEKKSDGKDNQSAPNQSVDPCTGHYCGWLPEERPGFTPGPGSTPGSPPSQGPLQSLPLPTPNLTKPTVMSNQPDGSKLPKQSVNQSDPVEVNGEFVIRDIDLQVPGYGFPFEFRRIYRSRVHFQSSLGYGWGHNFLRRIQTQTVDDTEICGGSVYYYSESLERIRFSPVQISADGADIVYSAGKDVPLRLERHKGDPVPWLMTDGTGLTYHFEDASGTLDQITNAAGNVIQLDWDHSVQNGEGGTINSIEDTTGRKFYFQYDINPHPASTPNPARLKCISLIQGDCRTPLVSFVQASIGADEFDLTRVLDANGNGPYYAYDTQPASSSYIADSDLAETCRDYCQGDSSGDASCKSSGWCAAREQIALDYVCGFDKPGVKPFLNTDPVPAPAGCVKDNVYHPAEDEWTYDLDASSPFLAPHLIRNLPLFTYPDGPMHRYLWDTNLQWPGFHYCLQECIPKTWWKNTVTGEIADFPEAHHPYETHYDWEPWVENRQNCYTPAVRKISGVEPFPECWATLGSWFWIGGMLKPYLIEIEACKCMQAQNATFCYFQPSFPGCAALLQGARDSKLPTIVLGGYAEQCRENEPPKIHDALKHCPEDCIAECIRDNGAVDPQTGRRHYAFGRPEDLNHNLREVDDGEGRLVVKNDYGTDPNDANFDRVTKHQLGETSPDNIIGLRYHDLKLESLQQKHMLPDLQPLSIGTVNGPVDLPRTSNDDQYSIQPDAEHVVSMDDWQPVEICPKTCRSTCPIVPGIIRNPSKTKFPIGNFDPAAVEAATTRDPIAIEKVGATSIRIKARLLPTSVHPGAGLKLGGATLLPTADPATFSISGSARELDAAFAGGSKLSLRTGAQGTASVAIPISVNRNIVSKPAPTGQEKGESPSAPVQVLAVAHDAEAVPSGAEFFSALHASGFATGSSPIVFVRTGPTQVRMGPEPPASGQRAGIIRFGANVVELFATQEAQVYSLRGDQSALDTMFSTIDRLRLIIDPATGDIRAIDRTLISSLPDPGPDETATTCIACDYQAPHTGTSAAITAQTPAHAVVVTDIHGIVHTNYFDDGWRLLRSVNNSTKEAINYNYENGHLQGYMAPTGERVCEEDDFYGHPLQVSKFPAPHYLGDTKPQVTAWTYGPTGQLLDTTIDPFSLSPTKIHLERDGWDRVLWMDVNVNATTTERTTYSYDLPPSLDPKAVYPSRVTSPDGTVTKFSGYDSSAGGPTTVDLDATSVDPIHLQTGYDTLGHATRSGRIGHATSFQHAEYDPAGQLKYAGVVNPNDSSKWVDTTYSYNRSHQPTYSMDERMVRYASFDALGNEQLLIERASDGVSVVPRSTCLMHDGSGRLEFEILPQGSIRQYHYDDAGRLLWVEQGRPPSLEPYVHRCLNLPDKTGVIIHIVERYIDLVFNPGDLIEHFVNPRETTPVVAQAANASGGEPTLYSLPVSPPPVVGPGQPTNTISQILGDVIKPVWHTQVVETPSWPTEVPKGDRGVETILIREYLPGGFLKSETDGSKVGSWFVVDGFGRVIDAMDADPATNASVNHRWTGYDSRNRVIWEAVLGPTQEPYQRPTVLSASLPLKSMVEYEYDNLNRTTSVARWHFVDAQPVHPGKLKTVTNITYDDLNHTVTTIVDGVSPMVEQYDGKGRLTNRTGPGESAVAVGYAENGGDGDRVTAETMASGVPLKRIQILDNQGRLQRLIDATDGLELLSREYDSFGLLRVETTPPKGVQELDYDAFGRLRSKTQRVWTGVSPSESYGWDRGNHLVSVTSSNATVGAMTTQLIFDGIGRLIERDDSSGLATTSDYLWGSGRTWHVNEPSKTETTFLYDAAGRLQSQTAVPGAGANLDPSTIARSFTYEPRGLVETAKVDGKSVTIGYDSLGNRVSEVSDFAPFAVVHEHDAFGRPTMTRVDPSGGTGTRIDRTFDPLERAGELFLDGKRLAKWDYKGVGAPIQVGSDGVQTVFKYDQRARSTGIEVVGSGGATVAAARDILGPDGAPRLRVRTFNGQSYTDAYQVDENLRVIGEGNVLASPPTPDFGSEWTNAEVDASLRTGRRWRNYGLDAASNWTSLSTETGTFDHAQSLNKLNGYGTFEGNSVTYDGANNVTSAGQGTYVFDALGQLTQATVGTRTIRFTYDALGRRVAETDAGEKTTTSFVWDGVEVAAYGSGTKADGYVLRIGGDGVNQHVALVDQLGKGTVSYLHQANDESTLAVTRGGALVEGYLYTAYGETTFVDPKGTLGGSGSSGNRFLYQGHLYDPDLTTYYMRAREYSPYLGRFLSPDPLGLAGGSNVYAFVDGQPLTSIDPFGYVGQPADPGQGFGSIQWAANHGISPRYYVAFYYSWVGSPLGRVHVPSADDVGEYAKGAVTGGLQAISPIDLGPHSGTERFETARVTWLAILSLGRILVAPNITSPSATPRLAVGGGGSIPVSLPVATTLAQKLLVWSSPNLLSSAQKKAPPSKTSTRSAPAPENYRGRYNAARAAAGKSRLPEDWDAHHRIPQEYREHREFSGFDFDDPDNIRGVKGNRADVNVHQRITNLWAEFGEQNPQATRQQIEAFASDIDMKFQQYWWQ